MTELIIILSAKALNRVQGGIVRNSRFVDPNQGHLICNLDFAQAARLTLSQQVDLELDTATGPVKVKGRIIFISPVVDKASSLQEVKILFDNRDHRIRLGTPGRLILE